MRIIYNKYYPFKPFLAQNILGMIFCRGRKGSLKPDDINHEYIHTLQQKELLYVGFIIWYYAEWVIRYFKYHNWMKAYYHISLEREAYKHEKDLDYRCHRRAYAWGLDYLRKGSLAHEFVEFLNEIYQFLKEDFSLPKYLYIAFLIACIIIGQVEFHIYDYIIAPSYQNGTSMLRVPIVFACAYFITMVPTVLMSHEGWRLRQWQVWVLPLILVTIDGAGQGFSGYNQWAESLTDVPVEQDYLRMVGSYLFRSVGIIGMLCIFRWATSGQFGLYGVNRNTKYLRIYGMIFLMLLPVFVVVSLTPQFQEFYPRMDIAHVTGSFGVSDWKLILPFEICYANDYLGVESMFRGAMIIGLARWLGPRAVLPMIITYMCVHLGKPDLELCSSVFGGYVLGILAYRTHHLWGGIIIHLGIAMLFEVLGFIMP